MLEQINKAVEKQQSLVCFSRKQFDNNKPVVYNHSHYLTHYFYKFSDVAMVGVCLRGDK